MADEAGHAIHYNSLTRGTEIYGSDDVLVGRVDRVMDNAREHILDGIVFTDAGGTTRFVDGPEVQRTYERRVELNIGSEAALALGPPEPSGLGGRRKGRLGRILGGD